MLNVLGEADIGTPLWYFPWFLNYLKRQKCPCFSFHLQPKSKREVVVGKKRKKIKLWITLSFHMINIQREH